MTTTPSFGRSTPGAPVTPGTPHRGPHPVVAAVTPSVRTVRRRRNGVVAGLAWGLVLALVALLVPAGAAVGPDGVGPRFPSSPAPVVDANFPDPDVVRVDGVYHAYATNSGGRNVQHRTSTDLLSWTERPDAAPQLGAWVGECSFAPGGATDRCVWAPEVTEVEGGYALYYTARDRASQRQCIGLSLADTPDGPFVPVGEDPLVCPTALDPPDLGGAIDAATFAEDGRLWLLWKADGNCCDRAAILFAQELSADGTTLTGQPVELLRNTEPWEGAVVEAPTVVERDGTYYLFYSANDFAGGGYRTGYATAPALTGPWTRGDAELLTTDLLQGGVRGPGGQDVVEGPDGGLRIVFHGWDPTYSYRAMYDSRLDLPADGVPHVALAPTRYQAEDAVIRDARVVPDASASGGAAVGGLDEPSSSVTFQVHAERTGPATLAVRFANGTLDDQGRARPAVHRMSIGGRTVGTVTYAHTTWGNWQTVTQHVRLRAGWNTVTLTRVEGFVEVDALDLLAADRERAPALTTPPTVPGDAVRYEAEAGVVVDARVRPDAGASGGSVVGGLDLPTSSVTVRVRAERAGPATLGIRFANGSDRGGYPVEATHDVTVAGRDAGTVTYWHTRWGNWTTVTHPVVLAEGWNDVTLTRATFFAEVDAVDVW
ncbi:family 43 glycosylhydrolase [Jannaschia sp. R86511]|uniref:family 43 glycosylhydrolase n=1 Tax=Jannaschia sp. R86511 TaxID=3093853 RepID=UPI0036D437BE